MAGLIFGGIIVALTLVPAAVGAWLDTRNLPKDD
jgi:hypothetical protein